LSDSATSLKDIDVLISTTSAPGIPHQSRLIHLAHSAGVKLFVPAEWSMDGADRGTAIDKLKMSIREEAAKVGLPTAAFWPGLWIDYFPRFGFDLQNGKITIRGDGKADVSVTSQDDVTAYTVYALTEFKRETLEGGKFYFEAERIVSTRVSVSLSFTSFGCGFLTKILRNFMSSRYSSRKRRVGPSRSFAPGGLSSRRRWLPTRTIDSLRSSSLGTRVMVCIDRS
jgi:hypothetical protein